MPTTDNSGNKYSVSVRLIMKTIHITARSSLDSAVKGVASLRWMNFCIDVALDLVQRVQFSGLGAFVLSLTIAALSEDISCTAMLAERPTNVLVV